MNTQKIRILLTAIEEGSLTKAGDILGYTQSGASWTIKTFEEELGIPLLVKTNSGVEPTPEAQALMPTFRSILNGEDSLMQQVDEFKGLHRGTLRVGSFISTSMHWLPKVLSYFQEHYPEVQIHIIECGQDDMIKGLVEGTMDIALLSDPDSTEIKFIPVVEDPIVAAFSEKFDFSSYDYVSVEDLKGLPILMTKSDYDRDAPRVFEEAGVTPDIRYTSRDDFAVLSMVDEGLGVAILPELVIEGFPEAFSYRLIKPEIYRTLGIGIRKNADKSPLTEFFIKFIKENIR